MTEIAKSSAVAIAQELIRCPSVTPIDAGALDVLESRLKAMGFACTRYPFGDGDERVDNLYARLGNKAPNFCSVSYTHLTLPTILLV